MKNPKSFPVFFVLLIPSSLFFFVLFPFHVTSVTISFSQISSVVPKLIEQSAQLEESVEAYRVAQIQIAAAKLKTLIPVEGETIAKNIKISNTSDDKDSDSADDKDSDSADDKDSDSADDKDSDSADDKNSDSSDDEQVNVPNSTTILLNSFHSLLKSLKKPGLVEEIRALKFDSQQQVEEFVAGKEREAARKLLESVEAVRQIQSVLSLNHSHSKTPEITAKLLARLIHRLEDLDDEYDDFESLQKRLTSSKEERRKKAQKELTDTQAEIVKIIRKVAQILGN